jgi:hypothetical protein
MAETHTRELLATVDVRTLNSLRWGPLRQMFPGFVEQIELGRYLRHLLANSNCKTVEIQPHVEPNGAPSQRVFDVYLQETGVPTSSTQTQ